MKQIEELDLKKVIKKDVSKLNEEEKELLIDYYRSEENPDMEKYTSLCLVYDYSLLTEEEQDLHYEYHKNRVLIDEGVSKIMPKNIETHTIVTESGNVCVIRKPIGRTLGKVMQKMGNFGKEPDLYQAGEIIFNECRVFCEKAIENDEDELFSVKIACVGATRLVMTRLKKN